MHRAVALLILAASTPAHAGGWRVVGGGPAGEGEWPDAAALFSNGSFYCTGVLVAPDVVLTAAHCDLGLDEVVLGAHDYEQGGESIAVAETYSYPNSWFTYDVAAVVLEHAALTTPRAVATDCITAGWLEDGSAVTIVGYGATDEFASDDTTVLHEADAFVVDHDCTDIDEGCNPDVSPGGEVIAGGDGVDSCNGDSGGPLYLRTEAGDFLLGTTSRATNSATVPCGDGGIYVRADAIAEWVEEVTGRTLSGPDCESLNHAPVPSYDPASVPLGGYVEVGVHANDPDPGDSHVWELVTPPAFGNATVDLDGHIQFSAGQTDVGTAEFTVRVTDDGSPEASALLTIDVEVEPVPIHRGSCGCATGSNPFGAALAFALLIRRRR